MCLTYKLRRKQKKDFIDNLDIRVDGFVWLWKVFFVNWDDMLGGRYRPEAVYYEGTNHAVRRRISTCLSEPYISGFHCFISKDAAEENLPCWSDRYVVVPIKIRKTWITDVGYDKGYPTVVCKKMII